MAEAELAQDGGQRDAGSARRGGDGASGRGFAAVTSAVAALVLGMTVASVPVPFVVESPGPAYNTLGKLDGAEVITISGRQSYPAAGNLDLTTVYQEGGPASDVSLLELARSWMDPSRMILPVRAVYPEGVTRDEVNEQNVALMKESEETAVAAALGSLGIDYGQRLQVGSVLEGSPSQGKLEAGDRIVSVDGRAVRSLPDVQQALAAGAGEPAAVVIERAGKRATVTVAPAKREDRWVLGVGVAYSFTFPFEVEFELGQVGGPSAGLMFALGIVDELTPGSLTEGAHVAGTGSISPDGKVGAIGGIVQKMHGARSAGATLFLAPAENCAEVVGHIPEGLAVARVATLGEARDAVEAYGRGEDPARLPQCSWG
ncbi:YlbL family protein [Sinomonas halotolerans]|uniref:endopeptidase La n=1 Tax=Sinomonas halotolerans TaxID=1644133 RepID=A0ABU9WWC4_9MICC